jgi:cytochrome P450
MGIRARKISVWDWLRLQLLVTLPVLLWGVVVPNRPFVGLLTRWDVAGRAARFIAGLRRTYGCEHLWVRFPLQRTLLVLDPATIDEVLDSDANTADPDLKRQALSRLVPDALIVSRGAEWQDRRGFNESVLAFGKPHPHRDAFHDIVAREAESLAAAPAGFLRWSDFEAFAQRVSQQVVLGSGELEPALAVHLAHLAGRANLVVLPAPAHDFDAFYQRIDAHLDRHRAAPSPSGPSPSGCLIHDSARGPAAGATTASTRVPAQVGFWLFVLKDALELHLARTLALIASHDGVQQRVREEIRQRPALAAADVDGLRFLEACLTEQMRLWTAVPLLLRRTDRAFTLRGEIPVRAEEQILVHAGFHHRDPERFGARADRFAPEAVTDAAPPLYVFSGGRQSCAGQTLARFLLKGALAALLAKHRFELVAPAIDPGRIPHACDHFGIELRALPAR